MPDSWVTDQPQLTPSSPRGAPLIRCVCSCRTAQLRSTVLTCMCLAQEKKKRTGGTKAFTGQLRTYWVKEASCLVYGSIPTPFPSFHTSLPFLGRHCCSLPGSSPRVQGTRLQQHTPGQPQGPAVPSNPGAAAQALTLESKPRLVQVTCKTSPFPSPEVPQRTGSALLGIGPSAPCFKTKPLLKCFMGLGPEHSISCKLSPMFL